MKIELSLTLSNALSRFASSITCLAYAGPVFANAGRFRAVFRGTNICCITKEPIYWKAALLETIDLTYLDASSRAICWLDVTIDAFARRSTSWWRLAHHFLWTNDTIARLGPWKLLIILCVNYGIWVGLIIYVWVIGMNVISVLNIAMDINRAGCFSLNIWKIRLSSSIACISACIKKRQE